MRYDRYLIVSDFDGSVAYEEKVSDAAAASIRRFQENGGRFTFASGRSHKYLSALPNVRANAPLISLNGNMVTDCDTGRVLHTFTLYDDAEALIRGIIDNTAPDGVELCGTLHGHSHLRNITDAPQLFKRIEKPWYKAVFGYLTREAVLSACEWTRACCGEKYQFMRTWPTGAELYAASGGKGNCLPVLRQALGEDRIIIALGDYENDLSLLRMADVGFAPPDALAEVCAAADFESPLCSLDPVGEILRRIDCGDVDRAAAGKRRK